MKKTQEAGQIWLFFYNYRKHISPNIFKSEAECKNITGLRAVRDFSAVLLLIWCKETAVLISHVLAYLILY